MKKRAKITTLFCAAALLVSSVLSPVSATVQAKAKKPILSKKKLTITLGKTAKLKVKRASGCKITWKSKKKKIVTVKKSGKYAAKLQAKKKGTAKVVATVKKGKKRTNLTCTVKVAAAKKVVTDPAGRDGSGSVASPSPTPQGSTGGTGSSIPTATSGGSGSGTTTATPDGAGTATPTPTATSGGTVTTPTATPAGAATPTPTATSTTKPTETTGSATATPAATDDHNAVAGSTVKGKSDATVTASVGAEGAVAEFEASGQFKQADFLLASPVSLNTVESVEFTLSVEGTPDSVCFKLYDSDGNEISKITQYNKKTGTYSIRVPDECKDKTVAQYSIMTNSDIKDTTQTAKATLTKLTFIGSSGGPIVVPTPTAKPVSTPVPTQKPAVTPAPEEDSMTFSADTFLTSAATSGDPVYNEDGSVTVTLKSQYGGGGIAFSLNESQTLVDLSDYQKVIFTLSADEETPLTISAYRSSNFWDSTADTGSIVLSYKSVTTEKTDYSFEFNHLNSVLGFGVRYNASGASPREEVTVTIHSITLVKDNRDIADATENYSSLAELAAKYGLKMGTVMNGQKVQDQKYGDLMKYHFNSITAANEMKAYSMLDEAASKAAYSSEADSMPVVKFDGADAIMDFAKENGLKVRGHALVWDAGMKDWFFHEGYDTSKPYASTDVVKARLKNYIEQVLVHFEEKYPGIIYCWDVVNEAVGDTSSEYAEGDERHVRTMRSGASNPFYEYVGSDYVELSFQYTYEALQKFKETYPSMGTIKLYYNDYNTFYSAKRDAICALVNSVNKYKEDGSGGYVKLCDGVGMQSYIGGFGTQSGCMNEANIDQVKTAILKFAEQGVEVQVTELAVRNYQTDEETIAKHGDFYKKLFQAYLDLNAGDEKPLKAISIWGIVDIPDLPEDDYSFTMNGPFCGLFDDSLGVKPAFVNIHDLMKNGQ